jgi:hypothetical protein
VTITLIFPNGKTVEMHTDDNVHGWLGGMTFCSDAKCKCGWPKVEAKE